MATRPLQGLCIQSNLTVPAWTLTLSLFFSLFLLKCFSFQTKQNSGTSPLYDSMPKAFILLLQVYEFKVNKTGMYESGRMPYEEVLCLDKAIEAVCSLSSKTDVWLKITIVHNAWLRIHSVIHKDSFKEIIQQNIHINVARIQKMPLNVQNKLVLCKEKKMIILNEKLMFFKDHVVNQCEPARYSNQPQVGETSCIKLLYC